MVWLVFVAADVFISFSRRVILQGSKLCTRTNKNKQFYWIDLLKRKESDKTVPMETTTSRMFVTICNHITNNVDMFHRHSVDFIICPIAVYDFKW